METELRDRNVVITGASGGIGTALVDAFLAEGARVAMVSRRPAAAGERTLSLAADVTRPAELDAAFGRAQAAFGPLDVCVANAGIWPEEPLRLDELPEARVREVIDVNLLGTLWTARAFFRALRRDRRPGASLVLIGSTAGRFGEMGHVEYAASKAALRGIVRTLKNEIVTLEPTARVNLVEPGWTATPMIEETLAARPGVVEAATRTMPLRQLARPEDVARTVVFFASPALARHVTGEVVTVAGGMEGRVLWEG